MFLLQVVGRRVGLRTSRWSQMDQHGAKRITKGAQSCQNGARGTNINFLRGKVRQKAINKNKQNMVRKGRHQDVSWNSNYSAIAFFLDYIETWHMLGSFWEPKPVKSGGTNKTETYT